MTANILPGIDLARYGQGDGPRARRESGIPDGAPVLAMFGRLMFLKSQTDVIRAMAEATRVVPNAYGVICGGEGEATYGDRVRSLRHEFGLEGHVFVTGFVPDQLNDDIMAAADVVVHRAQRESFGLAADASGPRSLIDDGVTGMVVPIGDIDRLAEVFIDLLHRPERRAELGLRARTTSLRHGIERMVEQIEALWDLVLDGPAA